jgi:hypothetical protein
MRESSKARFFQIMFRSLLLVYLAVHLLTLLGLLSRRYDPGLTPRRSGQYSCTTNEREHEGWVGMG